ncbi:MAG: hypothetical protein WBC78_25395 [Candidatus Sulfotelmatobacter sp.]
MSKTMLKNLLYVCFSALGLLLIAEVSFFWWFSFWWWPMPHYYLPPEQRVVQQFETNRTDYVRFVALLREDQSVRYVGGDGKAEIDGKHGRLVPEYRELIGKIGAKYVIVREDGSMEFALWGDGCAVCSDSYMGVRYYPKDHKAGSSVETQTVVTSLDSAKLPQEKGAVASGLYVVPIEPEWFVYRFEYRE